MTAYSVLIVDDEPQQLERVQSLLQEGMDAMAAHLGLLDTDSFTVAISDDAGAVADGIKNHKLSQNIILADIFMPIQRGGTPVPGGGAKRIYQAIKDSGKGGEIILVVMSNRDSEARSYFKEIWNEQSQLPYPWAINYVKPELLRGSNAAEKLFDRHQWVYAVCRAIVKSRSVEWRHTFLKSTMFDIVGLDPSFMQAKVAAEQFADEKVIMLSGESGTGKELIARAIHSNSTRSKRRFEARNCNSIPETLIESEIFGHERGTFTNAFQRKPSLFEVSNDGTVFLDEFGADREQLRILDTKLRRLVSEGEYTRVGGAGVQTFAGTIIFGGSGIADLRVPEDISRDLYERIKTFHISLPPLRKRVDDIVPLAEGFLAKLAKGDPVKILSPEARQLLLDYRWPGNIRELENCMKLLAGTLMTRTIERSDLAKALRLGAVDLLPVSKHEPEGDITPERLLDALKSVDGNRVEAARILWPNYTLDEIRSWVRQRVDHFVREFSAGDPTFAEQLPEAYYQRSVGGRPKSTNARNRA
jgi:DNA-binding NtrC family response regulator/CheY-like chemotaxis protein